MIALTHVVVALDLAEPWEEVLACGRTFAESFGATLHLVYVVDDLAVRSQPLATDPDELRQIQKNLAADARLRLEAIAAGELSRVAAHIEVLTANRPAAAIVAYANTTKAELIVAGTHGRTGLAEVVMGSVAQEIVRRAPCPVLTVRRQESQAASTVTTSGVAG
jgi:nucleotide-binding universal stress UspA family protein